MNLVILLGNLGADPELRYTTNGTPVANFPLATTEKWKDDQGVKQEKTTWHKIQAWGVNATNCANFLTKGSKLQITGKLDEQPWTDAQGIKRYPTFVIMKEMEMLGDPQQKQAPKPQTQTYVPPAPPAPITIPPPPAPPVQTTPIPPPPPQKPVGPSYDQLIKACWTPEQIAADPRFAHLVTGQPGFLPPQQIPPEQDTGL